MSDENQSLSARRLSRRVLLRSAGAAAGAAAVLFGLAGPAQAKMSQKAAGYQPTPSKDGASCASCALFTAPSTCALVDGAVAAGGWCRFYSKKA